MHGSDYELYPLFGVAVAYVAGIAIALSRSLFDPKARAMKTLQRGPITPVRDLRQGKVQKIVGDLNAVGETLTAPITGRSCAYYFVTVMRGETAIAEENRWVDFVVADETGRAAVRMAEAQVLVRWRLYRFLELPDVLVELCRRRGITSPDNSLSFKEGAVEIGARITVVGHPMFEADPEARTGIDYRVSPLRARFQASGRIPLLVSDGLPLEGNAASR
jgi:hypothetical protein